MAALETRIYGFGESPQIISALRLVHLWTELAISPASSLTVANCRLIITTLVAERYHLSHLTLGKKVNQHLSQEVEMPL